MYWNAKLYNPLNALVLININMRCIEIYFLHPYMWHQIRLTLTWDVLKSMTDGVSLADIAD